MRLQNWEFDLAILDVATERTLRSMSPALVTFKREPQIEDSLIFFILNWGELGEIGRIELTQRGANNCTIEMRDALHPSDNDVIRYLSSVRQEEHSESVSILIELQRSRLAGTEADYGSMPTLRGLSRQEKYQRVTNALQEKQAGRLELEEKRQSTFEQVVAEYFRKLPEEIAARDAIAQSSSSEISSGTDVVATQPVEEIPTQDTPEVEQSEASPHVEVPVKLGPSKSRRGRKSRYSLETMYNVIMEWEESQQGRIKGEKFDEWDIDFVEPDGAKRLEEFLDDKFGRNNEGNLNVAPRTFQKWGENFRTGKWKLTKTPRKKTSKRSRN